MAVRFRSPAFVTLALLCSLIMAGCASSQYVKTVSPPPETPGIYHRLERGESLWKISKIYDIDLDRLVKVNRIIDVRKIAAGRLIFIPGRLKEKHQNTNELSGNFIWPLKGKIITAFGETHDHMVNKGINIKTYSKNHVLASRSGKVVFFNENFNNYGKTIIIDHQDGLMSVYSKNSKVYVKAGDSIKQGTTIAETDTYLHFEIREGSIAKNPLFYLP
ncbi:MAG: peptidoglycan DD-metalloendopeptidase family protein [Candidatus Omnitrophica bacterium]|nr:peptidoglycan DD-metalloendopeptidase family protein [Candidatus Omnitrophota bacterium]